AWLCQKLRQLPHVRRDPARLLLALFRFFEPKWRRVLFSLLGKLFIISGNPEHDCLRFGFFHFIGVGTYFLGAHTPTASSKVVRCIIRHARPSQISHRLGLVSLMAGTAPPPPFQSAPLSSSRAKQPG